MLLTLSRDYVGDIPSLEVFCSTLSMDFLFTINSYILFIMPPSQHLSRIQTYINIILVKGSYYLPYTLGLPVWRPRTTSWSRSCTPSRWLVVGRDRGPSYSQQRTATPNQFISFFKSCLTSYNNYFLLFFLSNIHL